VLGIGSDGRKNGFGAILFEDAEEAKAAAKEMHGHHIGDRYVELSLITYGDYSKFNGPGSGGNTTKLSKYVGPDNQDRALVMRGLPYRVTDDDVIQFFKGYANLTSDDIYIEEFNGKRTGSALVIFESKDVA